MDDPRTYDLSEFALEFTWALMFWNTAELTLKQLVAELIGNSSAPAIAVSMDLGNRGTLHALETVQRELVDDEIATHLAHLATGFSILLGYRNLYAHSLIGVGMGDTGAGTTIVKVHGFLMRIKGEGRLRVVSTPLTTEEVSAFKAYCLSLSNYARAIMEELDVSGEWDLSGMLGMPPPSLEKPTWPKTLQNSPSYLQE
jgi:hypothetical protein